VVAFAGIAGYTLPSQDLGAAVRLIRLGLVLAAVAAGLFGVGAALCLVLLHLSEIDSLGQNYTAPLSDGEALPLSRMLLRAPHRESERGRGA
jgi:Bacillus/Clostridium GerA spore germination protein.